MQKLKEKNSSFIRIIASAILLYMILMIIILSAIWWNTRITLESAAGATLSQAKEILDYSTAVSNVIQQYLPGIACGSVDTESALSEFRQALKEAGYDDILNAKQEQLDAWLAQQK